ncbi:MAG: hypothetical protein F4Z22_05830 [Acidimicrobiia bacterium]|nr:hypothetical protein [Acidimicrobiia bacterium]
MVQGDEGVRLATAEVGLQLHDGVAAAAGETLNCAGDQLAEPLGYEGAPVELGRVAVLGRGRAAPHLVKVGGVLRHLETPGGDVVVRLDDLPPRRQPGRHPGLGALRPGAPSAAALLLELQAQQFLVQATYLVRLRAGGGDSSKRWAVSSPRRASSVEKLSL